MYSYLKTHIKKYSQANCNCIWQVFFFLNQAMTLTFCKYCILSRLILSDAQNVNAIQSLWMTAPQDHGFQGNKGESLRYAGAQTNDGGKLDQAPCKTVTRLHSVPTSWSTVIYQLRVNVCTFEHLVITHVRHIALNRSSLVIPPCLFPLFSIFPISSCSLVWQQD